MPECSNCGTHLTDHYVRVFGDNGTVDGCRWCGDDGDTERQTREDRFEGGSIPTESTSRTRVEWTAPKTSPTPKPQPNRSGQTSLNDYA